MKVYGGVDIGGTSVKFALVDSYGSILFESSFKTDSERTDFDQAMQKIVQWMNEVSREHSLTLLGIGVGCTGPVDRQSGIIENPYTLPRWAGRSLIESLHRLSDLPVLVENDANAALYGELMHVNQELRYVAMLTFGTGVGLSVYLGDEFYRLPSGFHSEAGHLAVGVDSPFTCYCGKNRCLENIISGTAINRDAYYFFQKSPEELLQQSQGEDGKFFLGRLVDALEEAVLNIAIFFHSEIIILGGGLQQLIIRHVAPLVQERIQNLKTMYGGTKLIPSALGEKAGMIGSALLMKHFIQENNK